MGLILGSVTRPNPSPLTVFGPGEVRLWLTATRGVDLGTPPQIAAWQDSSGLNNDGAQAIEATRPESVGGVVDFTAASLDTLTVPDSPSLGITDYLTLAFRVRPDVLTGAPAWLTKGATGLCDWAVQYAGELRLWFGVPGLSGGAAPAASFSAGAWRTVVMVYDKDGATNPDRLKMWVDGTPQSLTFYGTIPGSITDGTSAITLASWNNGLAYLDGAYREIVIAAKAATAEQVAELTVLMSVTP